MLGELLALLFSPLAWLLRVISRKRATKDEIKRFYRSAEWKRQRYAHLAASPACKACGASAKDGARMNVDHIRPLHASWHRRLDRTNLQARRAADFLLAWHNAEENGGWDRVDLWSVDAAIADDILTVVRLIRDSHAYPNAVGFESEIAAVWRFWRGHAAGNPKPQP